jgi:hypothetical protein
MGGRGGHAQTNEKNRFNRKDAKTQSHGYSAPHEMHSLMTTLSGVTDCSAAFAPLRFIFLFSSDNVAIHKKIIEPQRRKGAKSWL